MLTDNFVFFSVFRYQLIKWLLSYIGYVNCIRALFIHGSSPCHSRHWPRRQKQLLFVYRNGLVPANLSSKGGDSEGTPTNGKQFVFTKKKKLCSHPSRSSLFKWSTVLNAADATTHFFLCFFNCRCPRWELQGPHVVATVAHGRSRAVGLPTRLARCHGDGPASEIAVPSKEEECSECFRSAPCC